MRTTIKIDSSDALKFIREVSEESEKAFVKGLNNVAFEIRGIWLKTVDANVENPKPFTKKVFVNKAKPDSFTSEVFFPDIQSSYLEKLVEGGVRKGGDYATLGDEVLVPVRAALDSFGNFPSGPKRWVVKQKDRYRFIGRLPGQDRRAVYQRKKNERKLTMLARFVAKVDYKETLPLYEKATEAANLLDLFILRELDKIK